MALPAALLSASVLLAGPAALSGAERVRASGSEAEQSRTAAGRADSSSAEAASGGVLKPLPAGAPADPPSARSPAALRRYERQPVALALADSWLYVANRVSGSVSVIDVRRGLLVEEHRVGGRLTDLEWLVPGRLLLATDESAHAVLVLSASGSRLRAAARIPVTGYPQSVCVLPRGPSGKFPVVVAGLWSRAATVLELDADERTSPDRHAPGESSDEGRPTKSAASRVVVLARRDVALPFPAREQCALPDGRHVLIAAAFSGEAVILDTADGVVRSHWLIPGHNIRGLALSADRQSVLFAQQMLNPTIETERSRIFWGGVIGNVVRTVALSELGVPVDADAKLLRQSGSPVASTRRDASRGSATLTGRRSASAAGIGTPAPRRIGRWTLYPLGEPKNAAGDPGHMAWTPQGRMLICLTGVGELGRQDSEFDPLRRLRVGDGPCDVLVAADGKQAYVANRFSDSVSVIDLTTFRVENEIALGPRPALNAAQRGERLFYNARLSLDGWYSCHSCHTDGHTNGMLNDNASDATFGTPKKIPSLLGTAGTAPWGWFGNRPTLEEQVRQSIRSTMAGRDGPFDTDRVAADIAAYLRSLPPIPSAPPPSAAGRSETDVLARGRRIFHEIGCADCHAPPHYTSDAVYDVGLKDEFGVRTFNPPSLLGVREKAPYFHDHSAPTLQDVLQRHPAGPSTDDGHPPATRLSEVDRRALIAFLKSL